MSLPLSNPDGIESRYCMYVCLSVSTQVDDILLRTTCDPCIHTLLSRSSSVLEAWSATTAERARASAECHRVDISTHQHTQVVRCVRVFAYASAKRVLGSRSYRDAPITGATVCVCRVRDARCVREPSVCVRAAFSSLSAAQHILTGRRGERRRRRRRRRTGCARARRARLWHDIIYVWVCVCIQYVRGAR